MCTSRFLEIQKGRSNEENWFVNCILFNIFIIFSLAGGGSARSSASRGRSSTKKTLPDEDEDDSKLCTVILKHYVRYTFQSSLVPLHLELAIMGAKENARPKGGRSGYEFIKFS